MISTLLLLPLLAVAAPVASPPCHPIDAERITAADLVAALPEFAAVAPDAVIGYAPQPGALRNIEPAELTRFAAAHGLEYHGLERICFEPALAELVPSQIEASIRESLTAM